ETGLAERVRLRRPLHPPMVYFADRVEPLLLHDEVQKYEAGARRLWGEQGDLQGYGTELSKVREYLLVLFRDAGTPEARSAREVLGDETYRRWITGSAKELFGYYFTSDKMKILKSMSVTESGP